MKRNLSEKIAEWGLRNNYAPGDLTVAKAVARLAKTSKRSAEKYFERFRYSISPHAANYIEREILEV